jgi:hypothetical protein
LCRAVWPLSNGNRSSLTTGLLGGNNAGDSVVRPRFFPAPPAPRRLGWSPDPSATKSRSVATLHRLLDASTLPILVAGKARRTRCALRRSVRGDSGDYPLYAVDVSGRATQVASLSPLAPSGACLTLAATDWPLIEEARDGWWDGLSYPLYDMRTHGYLGRQLARAIQRELSVPDDPDLWNDDILLRIGVRVGYFDLSGGRIDANCRISRGARPKPSIWREMVCRDRGGRGKIRTWFPDRRG